MSDTTIARRYAQALYQEAEEKGVTTEVDRDMETLAESLRGSRDLRLFFASPLISREKKEAVAERLFSGRMHPMVLQLVRLLMRKRREELFPILARTYRALRDERLGIAEAEVRLAARPAEEELGRIERSLAAMTGKEMRLHVHVDPALIGGAVVRIGDRVYDGSVRHQLSLLREQLQRGT